MSEVIIRNLVNFAEKERAKIEPFFSAETACPGPKYKFDKLNPSLGQCAITSRLAGEDFLALSAASDVKAGSLAEPLSAFDDMLLTNILNSFPISAIDKQVIRQLLPDVEAMFNNDETFHARTKGFEGKWALLSYGDILYGDEPLSDDHCWLRVVSLKEMFDPKAGYHLETTLDQFSTKTLPLPKGLVQFADPKKVQPMQGYDEPFRYIAQDEQIIVPDGSLAAPDELYLTAQRLAILKEKVNKQYRFWEKLN
jgi:hypothetical protein